MFYRPLIFTFITSSLSISLACAQEIVQLEKIEVQETASTIEERKESSIAKRIISGEELAQYGDLNALEILKRTPGVSIAEGKGKKSALGKGYTVILIDGEEASGSKRVNPLEQISPDMIERIEVMTNGSAEYTAESMGGIVNVVLKKPKSEGQTIAKITVGTYGGDVPMESVFAQREGKSGKLGYLINVSAADNRQTDTSSTSKQSAASDERKETEARYQTLTLTTKLIYTPSSKDKYTYNGSIGLSNNKSTIDAKTYLNGSSALNAQLTSTEQSKGTMLWSGLKGEHHLSGTELLEWKLKFHQNDEDGEATSLQTLPIPNDRRQKEYGFNRMIGAGGSYSLVSGDHFIKTGVDLKKTSQSDEVQRNLNGANATTLADSIHMRENKGAIYLQDEVSIGESFVVTPGIRYETLSRDYGTTSRIDYLAPSLHMLYRLSSNDNLRASIAKTVKLPRLDQLSSSTDSSLDRNDIRHPDITGNQNLTEEKALSYELRYEHFFENKGIASIGGFYRTIDDKIENITRWNFATSRYVQSPENAGQGSLWGLELELKKSLNVYVDGLGMFANATLQDSSLTNTATGTNRPIKQTSNFLYNLGLDHTVKEYRFTYGAAYRYVGGYDDPEEYSLSQSQKGYGALDLYASKRLNKTFKCQLNLKNITRTSIETTSNVYSGGAVSERQIDKEHSKPQILLSLEGKW